MSTINPRIVELLRLVCGDFLDAYDESTKVRPSAPREEHVNIAVGQVLGSSAFSMKSVLDGFPGLNLERARTLTTLHELGGTASLLKIYDKMEISRQAAYARMQALCANGYAYRGSEHGQYEISKKGRDAAEQINSLE